MGFFPTRDMQIRGGHIYMKHAYGAEKRPFKSGQIYMKNAQCAITNEKLILRSLVFEIWLILYKKSEFFLY